MYYRLRRFPASQEDKYRDKINNYKSGITDRKCMIWAVKYLYIIFKKSNQMDFLRRSAGNLLELETKPPKTRSTRLEFHSC